MSLVQYFGESGDVAVVNESDRSLLVGKTFCSSLLIRSFKFR